MIQEQAVVVALDGDHAVVVGQRQSSCGSCHQEGTCATLSFGGGHKEVRLRVANPVGARVGDRVLLEMSERHMLRASFLAYIVPVLALFVGGFLFRQLGLMVGVSPQSAETLGGVVGVIALMLVFFWLKHHNRKIEVAGGGQLLLKAVIEEAPQGVISEGTVFPLQFHPRRQDSR
ncbi:MAG: SoxR reducing system RseC family protein [Nitrospirae bacterium]|nr:SoxR reducing system RseC family protein [Magnetococcales bacterium]